MKSIKTFFAFVLSIPFLYMPVELALEKKSKVLSAEPVELSINSNLFGDIEWMISNLEIEGDNEFHKKEFFTYDEIKKIKPQGWDLPTANEIEIVLASLGFDGKPGFVPSEYYSVNWQFKGYIDPILGHSNNGEKMLFWIKDDGTNNYVVINAKELTYKLGFTLSNSQLPVRFIRK